MRHSSERGWAVPQKKQKWKCREIDKVCFTEGTNLRNIDYMKERFVLAPITLFCKCLFYYVWMITIKTN